MRNLKKFLALVLAFVMAMSLMVTVNAASSDFTDAEDINEKFAEAVEVLSGMGVFQGTEENGVLEFLPKSSVTRAQMAAVVYRLATGDWNDTRAHLYSEYQKFSDVSSDAWYAGYVGYCADAEIIKGYGNGTFGPNRPVTGYQALAMLLRAVGYGQNGEFEGTGWTIQVGATATGEGLLKNVNSSSYAGTLNETAVREMLAEISFQAAQIPTVRYQYGVYNKYTTTVTIAGGQNEYNPSLGYKFYGLTERTGIVVGNQETNGSEVTSVSFETELVGSATYYTGGLNYSGAYNAATGPQGSGNEGNVILNFDAETGLDMFGHAIHLWYDDRGTTHKTYTWEDAAVKSDLVASTTGDISASGAELAAAAEAMDYAVGDKAYASTAYGTFGNTAATANSVADSPSDLYLLISNHKNTKGEPVLDAVVSLNVEGTQITAVNAHVTKPNVSVAYTHDGTANANIISTDTGVAAAGTGAGSGTMGVFNIYNSALTANSVADFQAYVLNNAIGGVAAANVTNYHLSALEESDPSKVVGFYNLGTDKNTDPDYVLLANGEKIYKSPYYDVVANADGTTDADTVIPQVGGGVAANEVYNNGEWTFILKDGKYVGAYQENASDSRLIYATYMDYETVVGSGTLKYYIVGVDMDGEQVKLPVERYTTDNGANFTTLTQMDSTLGLPYHDSQSHMGTVKEGVYTAVLMKGTDAYVTTGVGLDVWSNTFNADIEINKTSQLVGVKETKASSGVYITEKTKFVLVEGLGTDTAKAEIYTGISGLLGDYSSVTIHLETSDDATARKMPAYITGATAMDAMTWCSTSKFVYAQSVGGAAEQLDLVVLPKSAVEFTATVGSSLYYVGDNTPTLVNATGEKATQFTMYTAAGDKVSVWVDGLVDTADSSAKKIGTTDSGDAFYELSDSGKTTSSGEKIYNAVAHTSGTDGTSNYPNKGTIEQGENYSAATKDSQTATIKFATYTLPYRVTGARVVNLDTDTYPGIVDLATLNDASSVNNTGTGIKVSCVMDTENTVAIAVIFVCANQS